MMLIPGWEACELVVEKAYVCIDIYIGGWIYCCCHLYFSSDMDSNPIAWLCDKYEEKTLFCDSSSAIHGFHNLVQHIKTIYIPLRYHFIKYHVEDGNIDVHFVKMTDQHADIFTKLHDDFFLIILNGLGMMEVC